MSDSPGRSLEERLVALEQAVEELQRVVRRQQETPARSNPRPQPPAAPSLSPPRVARTPFRAPGAPPAGSAARAAVEGVLAGRSAEWWLNRVGIGLLLLGVAFLFKYSVDRGWLTPAIRIAFGAGLGGVLAVIGLRVDRARRWFTPVMFGGAAATWYITGFAAFQVFRLIPHVAAFAFMVAVTIFTLWAALREDEPILGVLAAAGGFGTPFLLYAGSGWLSGLVGYTVLVLLGMSLVFLARGWTALLLTTTVGGWGALFVGYVPAMTDAASLSPQEQWVVQLGVLAAWLATWAVPVIHHVRSPLSPAPGPVVAEPALVAGLGARLPSLLTITVPLIAFFFSREIWVWADRTTGLVAGAGAGAYAGLWWLLGRRLNRGRLASMHAVGAAVFAALAAQFLLEGQTLLLTWAVEAAALHAAARHLDDRPLAATGHALFGVVALWLLVRLLETGGVTLLDRRAVVDLAVLAAAVVAASRLARPTTTVTYHLAAAAGFALLLRRELLDVGADGGGLVLASWAVLGLALHYAGRLRGRPYALLAHLILAAVGAWLAWRFVLLSPTGTPIVNLRAACHAVALAGLVGAARAVVDPDERFAYLMAAHVGLMAWLWYELARGAGGEGAVTAAWGVYATLLLVHALLRRHETVRNVALGTLAATVGKLFLVDLSRIEAIWRILLFLGLGAAFLTLSYYFRQLWNRGSGGTSSVHSPRRRVDPSRGSD